MIRPHHVVRALGPWVLFGLAREVDAALGVALHTTLDVPGLSFRALGLIDVAGMVRVAAWLAAGVAAWPALAVVFNRDPRLPFAPALESRSDAFLVLLLRPAVTLLALASVAWNPVYPYALTLPVALSQDLAPLVDAVILAALVAAHARPPKLPAVPLRVVWFAVFAAYLWLVPAPLRLYDGHTGNEPKTMRMAVSLGLWGTLDVENVTGPMEGLAPRTLAQNAETVVRTATREAAALLWAGPASLDPSAIRARRVARQTVSGKDGGVFHVLAPGPSLVLAPALRADRALNLRAGTPGPVTVSLVLWAALAACLVVAMARAVADATGAEGLGTVLALVFAFTPPFLFYFCQFYPEMPGALLLILLLRRLLLIERLDDRGPLGFALGLACLPWLHQKFLPVWAVIVGMAIVKSVHDLVPSRVLVRLVVPQIATLFLYALYNFAITGSARLDALYLAWGPRGVSSSRVGQGLVGLLLDARYGILPYAPLYLVAAAGAFVLLRSRSACAWAGIPAIAYYATVAAADNWSGAICNLGRYVMPLAPLLVVCVGVAVGHVRFDRGRLAVVLALGLWTAVLARALWLDPHAANDSALLLAKSAFADGNVYIPNLFIRGWSEAAPGTLARIGAWLAGLCLLAGWLVGGRRNTKPLAAGAGLLLVLVGAAMLLERWPSERRLPLYSNRLELGPGVTLFADGPAVVRDGRLVARRGDVAVLVRARRPLDSLVLTASGDGTLTNGSGRPLRLRPAGVRLVLSLEPALTLRGRRGLEENLLRVLLRIDADGEVGLALETGAEPAAGNSRAIARSPSRTSAAPKDTPARSAAA